MNHGHPNADYGETPILCPLTKALFRATEQWESFDIDFKDLPNITQVHDAGEMTFIDAQFYCEKIAGWSLPIPLDQAQNDRIENLITKSAWLGVRGIEGSWYHAYITKYVQYEVRDFFTLLFYNWAENEPAWGVHSHFFALNFDCMTVPVEHKNRIFT